MQARKLDIAPFLFELYSMRCIIKKYHESSQVDRMRKWINNNGNFPILNAFFLSYQLVIGVDANCVIENFNHEREFDKRRNGDTPHILQTKWTHSVGSLMILVNYNNNGDKWLRVVIVA